MVRRVQLYVIVLGRRAGAQRREGATSHPNMEDTICVILPKEQSAAWGVGSFEKPEKCEPGLKTILHFKLGEGVGGQKGNETWFSGPGPSENPWKIGESKPNDAKSRL